VAAKSEKPEKPERRIPKPNALATDIVFLDTCIFLSERFNSSAYQTLLHLGSIGAVKLKTTDITLKEVRKNIEEMIGDAIVSLQAKAGKSAILQNFDGYNKLMEEFKPQKSKALAEELWKRVEQELKDAGVEIIVATEMAAGPIFESYFDGKPPFGTGEKRKEFPDAFVIAALDNWCGENSEEIYVITTDGTVLEACEAADGLHPLEFLADFVDLALRRDEYVERAVEYLEEHRENIEEAVKAAVEDSYIHLHDEDGDGEATVNKVSWLSIEDVVKNDRDTMVLRCSASVNLSVSVSYADRNMTMYDSEDKQEYVFGHVSEDLDRDVEVTAEVTILWEDPANYVVERTVINDGDSISVYVDEDAETNWK
jgi:hypothetical protein